MYGSNWTKMFIMVFKLMIKLLIMSLMEKPYNYTLIFIKKLTNLNEIINFYLFYLLLIFI